MPRPLRLMVYDRTDPKLGHVWRAGGVLYRALGRLDAVHGASDWGQALEWLASVRAEQSIAEIQLWMHGHWGRALISRVPLDVSALDAAHPLHVHLLAIRRRLAPDALWWFRTCETLGKAEGQELARAWSSYFRSRVAGHTHVIGVLQSGLHVLAPGESPDWPVDEGVHPTQERGLPSRWRAPGTITFLHGRVPTD